MSHQFFVPLITRNFLSRKPECRHRRRRRPTYSQPILETLSTTALHGSSPLQYILKVWKNGSLVFRRRPSTLIHNPSGSFGIFFYPHHLRRCHRWIMMMVTFGGIRNKIFWCDIPLTDVARTGKKWSFAWRGLMNRRISFWTAAAAAPISLQMTRRKRDEKGAKRKR